MTDIIVIAIILLWGFFWDAERDTLIYRPHQSLFPKWEFWVRKKWQGVSWFRKTFGAFTLDGVHFTKFIFNTSVFSSIAYLIVIHYGLSFLQGILIVTALHLFYGAVFESNYGDKIL